jgi:hypothetical protein
MLTRCLECECVIVPGRHWMCSRHMHARAVTAFSNIVPPFVLREAELLRALVFDFPGACCANEFHARLRYAVDILCSRTRTYDLISTHDVHVRESHPVTRGEMRDLVCSLVEFVCRNEHASLEIVRACATALRKWYPAVLCASSLREIARSERVLHVLERKGVTRDFLVLADTILALASKIGRDATELVHTHYARGVCAWCAPRMCMR